jgi:hypothetical protein
MAVSIIRDVRELKPSAWVYWQPVEPDVPEYGWGLINANYIDAHDQPNADASTPLVRVNRKFFVFGQFTRFIRQGYQIIEINDANSLAAYDPASHRLVIITVAGDSDGSLRYDLSKFRSAAANVQRVATTTAPGDGVPDWKQHTDTVPLDRVQRLGFTSALYRKAIYTFVISDVSR